MEQRIATIDQLLAKKEKELSRLLDLYLRGSFEHEMLADQKQRLESAMTALRQEREDTVLKLKHSLSDGQLAEIQRFTERISVGLDAADSDFATRRKIFDALGVQVDFVIEDGIQKAFVYCQFGDVNQVEMGDESVIGTSSPQRESGQTASSHVAGAGNYSTHCRRSMDTVLRNQQIPFILVADLVKA